MYCRESGDKSRALQTLARSRQLRIKAARRWIVLAVLSFECCAWAGANTFPEFTVATARDYLQTVAQAVPSQIGESADTCILEARLRSQLGQQDQAERLARRALALDPTRADIQSFLADLFIRQDRLEEVSRCLRQALGLDPSLAGGHRRLGMVLDRLGDREGARDAFATAVRSSPEDASARLLLGRLLLDQGQPKEAAVHLEKACQFDPGSASALYALSQAQNRLGDREAARLTLATFQELKRKEKAALDAENATHDDANAMRTVAVEFHTDAALIFLRQKRETLAETHFRQAVCLAPQEAHGQERLAAFYLQRGRLPEARIVCQDLVRLRPNEVSYRLNLGTVLMQLKEYSAAVGELKRVLDMDAKQPEALNNLVRYYLGTRQNLSEALMLCRRLVDVRPTAANFDLLGWACFANGQITEARAASIRAVELDPSNAVYRERHQRLQLIPSPASSGAGGLK